MSVVLQSIDLAVIGIYFLVVLSIGFWISRSEKQSGKNYFVGGRSVGWLAIGASLFASNISSEHLIGLSADGFRTGLAVGNYEWGACLVLIVLAMLFAPFYIKNQISTMPEFLERRFGLGARIYLSLVTIVANVLVRLSVALYAGGIVLNQMFGLDMWTAIIGLAAVTVFYTALGGLKAVIYTDVIQTVILIAGTGILSFLALNEVGGWDTLVASLDPSYFKMIRPASDPEMPWTGLLLGVPVLGIWYWCTDQVIVQRVLAAKSVDHARSGALFAAFLKLFPVFLFVLPGLCGKVLFPEVPSKTIFPVLISHLLPPGITGLVAAALIAALMSSIDSTLNSTGTLVSLDFFERFKNSLTDKQLVFIGRVTTLVIMVFGIVWVNVVHRFESLFQYLQQVNAAISPPIAAAFLIGVLWKRANHPGILTGLLSGLGIGVGFMAFSEIPFLNAAGINFFLSSFVIVAVSLFTAPPTPAQTAGFTLGGVTDHSPHRLRYLAACLTLLAVCSALWVRFS